MCLLCTCSSAQISITRAVWGCVDVLPHAVSSLGGIAVPLHYKVMHIATCLGWKAPRSPPKADEQGFGVKTRLCYPKEWSWDCFSQTTASTSIPHPCTSPFPPESAAPQIPQRVAITAGEAAGIAFPPWGGNISTGMTLSGGQTARDPFQLPSLWSQQCQWGSRVQRDSRSLW